MGGAPPSVAVLPQRLPRVSAGPWDGLPPAPVTCAEPAEPDTCQWSAALDIVVRDGAEAAAAACLAIREERMRWECFFQAAERLLYAPRARRVESAARLCLGAGGFAGLCLATVTSSIVARAPSAAWGDEAGWRRLAASEVELQDALRPWDPDLGSQLGQGVWSVALAGAYAAVDPVGSVPLAEIAPDAAPFVRAAVAWRLCQIEREPHDAAWWVARVERALASEAIDESAPAPEPWERTSVGQKTHRMDDSGTIPYLVVDRRAWSSDPQADTLICVLEGNEREGRAQEALLRDAAESRDPALRATAERILAGHSPR